MTIDPVFLTAGLTAIGGVLGWLWWYVTSSLATNARDLSAHKLHVAETYTSKVDMAAFDLKITSQLVRIENKLDQQIGKH